MNKADQQQECNHNFQFANTAVESTEGNMIYHQIAYPLCVKCWVCVKCGEVRKNDI
ncbi:MAG: hypothetical protein AABY15_09815 [Nanoarchaeota archaeon]